MTKTLSSAVLVALLSLACQGPEGPEGPQGPQGPTGPRGPSGFASAMKCSQSSAGLLFIYEMVTYSGGDAIASCEITDGDSSYVQTEFLWAGTSTASEGLCLLRYDLELNNSGGFWTFRSDRTVRYSDSTSSANGLVLAFASSNCATR
jgi:hypothetical protein